MFIFIYYSFQKFRILASPDSKDNLCRPRVSTLHQSPQIQLLTASLFGKDRRNSCDELLNNDHETNKNKSNDLVNIGINRIIKLQKKFGGSSPQLTTTIRPLGNSSDSSKVNVIPSKPSEFSTTTANNNCVRPNEMGNSCSYSLKHLPHEEYDESCTINNKDKIIGRENNKQQQVPTNKTKSNGQILFNHNNEDDDDKDPTTMMLNCNNENGIFGERERSLSLADAGILYDTLLESAKKVGSKFSNNA